MMIDIPKVIYRPVVYPGTDRIHYVECALCPERIFDFSSLLATPKRYERALAQHFSGKHGNTMRRLSEAGVWIPEAWLAGR